MMTDPAGNRALIAMSGGVDSSVAALLMKERGYDCMGITMKLYNNEEIGISREKTCCSLDDVEDARQVAGKVGIPFYVLNFSDHFEECVIRRFVDTWQSGGTPNPCIDCNRFIKFDRLMQRMKELQYDYVVTGHYARVCFDEKRGRYLLRKAVDLSKDQSYVLYGMTQEQLAHTLFPLGEFHKSEIREIAEKNGFINARKHDSQDICFVPDGDYAAFIERYTGKRAEPGSFVSKNGTVLGTHKGLIRYTIGQRRGLGLSVPRPLYVCGKDMERNEVILGEQQELFTDTLEADHLNLISVEKIEQPLRCKARIRYKQQEDSAEVVQLSGDRIRVVFDRPQRGITKGQAVVLYDGDIVIGGGTII
ncbi:MAG: tRNA 2-thiouridine(34) synthase MnmA [Lachnospiraceae bacterium]|nr:tRNA 2-thiouridine(34) synthase MnmA [Lachnospiraceae bacterium]